MSELFTCSNCGGHELTVTHTWDIIAGGIFRESWQEWGPLDDDHHWTYEEQELIEELPEDDSEPTEGREDDPDSHEFFVNCTNSDCDREIEFGWSHPDRGGRIWPAECTDFTPWKCWPEPRYRESWKAKNWLRPVATDYPAAL